MTDFEVLGPEGRQGEDIRNPPARHVHLSLTYFRQIPAAELICTIGIFSLITNLNVCELHVRVAYEDTKYESKLHLPDS